MTTPSPRPLVSVVIIFLNEARFLREAIQSVLDQTFDDWELCLVDDGSTDASPEIARGFVADRPDRIRLIRHVDGGCHGMSASRNLGLRSTTGEYVTFLDGDDVFLPEKLERQVALLEAEPEAAMVVGRTITWYSWATRPAGQDHIPDPGVPLDALAAPPTLLRRLFADVPWAPGICAALFRRDSLERVGGFAGEFRDMYEDQVVWVKLFTAMPVFVSSGAWERYRQHAASNCVQAEQDGRFHPWYPNAARGAFLEWADRHLRASGHGDPETLDRLAVDLRPVRHPTAPAEVSRVASVSPVPDSLLGYSLECPKQGDVTGSERIRVFGWVIGRRSAARAVELLSAGAVVGRVAVAGLRADLEAAFPDVPAARHSGYHLDVPVVGVAPAELALRVVLEDDTTVHLATIAARRHRSATAPPTTPIASTEGHAAGVVPTRRDGRPGERRAAILMYHRVADDRLPDPWQLCVSPAAFAEQMDLLCRDYRPLPLDELARAAAADALPERAVAVTFDDGYVDNLRVAAPLLERYGVPATIFVTSGSIGGQSFWWDELMGVVLDEDDAHAEGDGFSALGERRYRALYDDLYRLDEDERRHQLATMTAGAHEARSMPRTMTAEEIAELVAGELIDVGAHTVSHPALPLLSVAAQDDEIRTSKLDLESIIGRPVRTFAYPHGRYTRATRELARRAGFSCAVAADAAPVFVGTDPFELPRMAVETGGGEALGRHLDDLFSDVVDRGEG